MKHNIRNILRYLCGKRHLWSEIASYKRTNGCSKYNDFQRWHTPLSELLRRGTSGQHSACNGAEQFGASVCRCWAARQHWVVGLICIPPSTLLNATVTMLPVVLLPVPEVVVAAAAVAVAVADANTGPVATTPGRPSPVAANASACSPFVHIISSVRTTVAKRTVFVWKKSRGNRNSRIQTKCG